MSPRMIRGWFMEIPSWRGRVGIPIPEFGLAARTSRSDSASESAGSEVLGGVGVTGGSIGITDTQCTTTSGITHGATRFITGTTSTGVQENVAEHSIVPAQQPGLSAETRELPEDTLNPTARAASAQGHSATMTMADRKGVFRHEEAPASAAEVFTEAVAEAFTEAVAGTASRTLLCSYRIVRFGTGEKPYVANEVELGPISSS